jgi:hypothetical protein
VHEFREVSKQIKGFLHVFRVFCVLQELKFPPKYIGHPTGNCWGSPAMLSE